MVSSIPAGLEHRGLEAGDQPGWLAAWFTRLAGWPEGLNAEAAHPVERLQTSIPEHSQKRIAYFN